MHNKLTGKYTILGAQKINSVLIFVQFHSTISGHMWILNNNCQMTGTLCNVSFIQKSSPLYSIITAQMVQIPKANI